MFLRALNCISIELDLVQKRESDFDESWVETQINDKGVELIMYGRISWIEIR